MRSPASQLSLGTGTEPTGPAHPQDLDDAVPLVALDGASPLRLLTRNGLEDHTPMFTADSETVVFRTRFPFEKTHWTLTTARSVPARK